MRKQAARNRNHCYTDFLPEHEKVLTVHRLFALRKMQLPRNGDIIVSDKNTDDDVEAIIGRDDVFFGADHSNCCSSLFELECNDISLLDSGLFDGELPLLNEDDINDFFEQLPDI